VSENPKDMAMELQPTLQGQSLLLRPLAWSDQTALTQAASDPAIWRLHPEPTRYLPEVFASVFESGMQSGSAFVIIDRVTGEVLGTSRYYELDLAQSAVAIGYTFLVYSRWGGPTNRELKQLMLQHAFKFVEQVWFHVGEQNWRSRKAVEKLGATLEKIASSPTALVPRNTAFYRLTKSQFEAKFEPQAD